MLLTWRSLESMPSMTTWGSTGVGEVVGGSAFGSLLTSLSPQPAVTSAKTTTSSAISTG